MATIIIKNESAHSAFHSMCEGMWEVLRDEIAAPNRMARLEALIEATTRPNYGGSLNVIYPHMFNIPRHLRAVARDVIENCLNSDDELSDDALILDA
jgi:hypothetical protein